MTKRDKYIKEMSKTPAIEGITTGIVANELCARATLKILMDKGIVTGEEWRDAIQLITERYVDLHIDGIFEEKYEPDFISFLPDEE